MYAHVSKLSIPYYGISKNPTAFFKAHMHACMHACPSGPSHPNLMCYGISNLGIPQDSVRYICMYACPSCPPPPLPSPKYSNMRGRVSYSVYCCANTLRIIKPV